ncbi:monofunctional biosynthetic peptidoglycan transglycosylase [Thiobacter aerophilum]|uniref:Biosynthetic peptidoglycan transglycosylase n=1 Tax=Thiobacter aerophilum TaxID=3121275 RepID=A0ABV0EED1_9BURK
MLKAIWRWLWRGLAVALLGVLLLQVWFLLHVWWYVDHNPSTTAFMERRLAELQAKLGEDAELKHKWVPYDQISIHLKRALIAAEDAKFPAHDGFDFEGIEKALEKNEKKGRVVAGGSTISQQLAKNLFLSGERSYLRKAQEAVITLMLEKMMTKRRILEIYLNVIEWGEGVYGAEAAARHYFHTSAARLNPFQAARLAAMVPRPRYFEKRPNSPYLARQTARILARMNQVTVPK